MEGNKPKPTTTDEYIAQFPEDIQKILNHIRAVIKETAPGAEERIAYRMPSFYQNGVLVYFAAFKSHIGFYPTGSGIEAFKNELSGYQWSKGAVQFPLDKPMPDELIRRIVQFKLDENLKKGGSKKKTPEDR